MAEESRSTCFPHCVISCFGIRKHRGRVGRHSKAKQSEKSYGNIVETPSASENGVDKFNNGCSPQQQVNGTIYSSSKKCNLTKDTNRLPDPVLIQPEKSALPLLEERLDDIPDSNGHATCENPQVILVAKDASGDCNTSDGLLNKAQLVDLPSTNRIKFDVNDAEQSQTTEKTEVLGRHSIENVLEEMTSPVPKNALRYSDTSQTVHPHSEEIERKENSEVIGLISEEISKVHNKEDNKCHAHFRDLLDKEKERLTSLVLEWSELLSTDINVEVQDEIRSVTGQTNLIITERFAQFNRLINRSEGKCEDNESDGKVIMASDLQGFWDMILFQVKDVLNKFERLEALRKSNWDLKHLNAEISTKKTPKKKITKNTGGADNDKEKARRLAARKRIAEARQRLKEQNQQTPEHGAIIL